MFNGADEGGRNVKSLIAALVQSYSLDLKHKVLHRFFARMNSLVGTHTVYMFGQSRQVEKKVVHQVQVS